MSFLSANNLQGFQSGGTLTGRTSSQNKTYTLTERIGQHNKNFKDVRNVCFYKELAKRSIFHSRSQILRKKGRYNYFRNLSRIVESKYNPGCMYVFRLKLEHAQKLETLENRIGEWPALHYPQTLVARMQHDAHVTWVDKQGTWVYTLTTPGKVGYGVLRHQIYGHYAYYESIPGIIILA